MSRLERALVLPPRGGQVRILKRARDFLTAVSRKGQGMAKKLLITELDLSSINAAERSQTIDRLIGLTTLYLEEHYPVAQGYRHKRRQFKPSEKTHPDLLGVDLIVQRGLIWGYSVRFTPLVVENQEVSVTLSIDQRWFDIVGFIALAPVLLLVAWVLGTGRIKVDFHRNSSDLVLGGIVLACLWFAVAAILWLLIGYLMSLKIDKQAQEQEMADIRAGIRDGTGAPPS